MSIAGPGFPTDYKYYLTKMDYDVEARDLTLRFQTVNDRDGFVNWLMANLMDLFEPTDPEVRREQGLPIYDDDDEVTP